ncbi:MAG TPA: hypothetical protein VMR52_07995 [Dehalococcoidia bacterium]|nr:hypothetical protein [Dehalococcoidia bacterium]
MAVVFDTMFANGPVVQIEELFAEETHSGHGVGETLVNAAMTGHAAWARAR